MAKRSGKRVDTFVHEEASRKNIPTAEHEPVMAEGDRSPVEVAYERRNRDLDWIRQVGEWPALSRSRPC